MIIDVAMIDPLARINFTNAKQSKIYYVHSDFNIDFYNSMLKESDVIFSPISNTIGNG